MTAPKHEPPMYLPAFFVKQKFTMMVNRYEIRAASPVTVFGRLLGDPTVFKPVRSGTTVRVERA